MAGSRKPNWKLLREYRCPFCGKELRITEDEYGICRNHEALYVFDLRALRGGAGE